MIKQRTTVPRKLPKNQEEKDQNHVLASATVSASYNMMFQVKENYGLTFTRSVYTQLDISIVLTPLVFFYFSYHSGC